MVIIPSHLTSADVTGHWTERNLDAWARLKERESLIAEECQEGD